MTEEEEYRPPLADLFDRLEEKYGDESGELWFDYLTDDELLEGEELGRQAIYEDPNVTGQEKVNLQPNVEIDRKLLNRIY